MLALQPHIRLLELQYPVDEMRIRVSESSEEHARASNAVAAPTRRHIVRRYARLKARQIFLAVHRVEFTVYYRRLEPDEFRLLEAIAEGRPLGEALAPQTNLDPDNVQTWFANWAQMGWLCRGGKA